MYILGIESTAHTFGVGIVTREGKVVANCYERYSSSDGGMIPHELAEHHERVAEQVLADAFSSSKLSWDDIDFISYAAGPGLDPGLWAGYKIAKAWGEKFEKKLVGANHCAAHLSIGCALYGIQDPLYLYVSGVNTQIIVGQGKGYHVVGETLDIGLGNMLDKFARLVGLGFPGGPMIEKLALSGEYVELPYAVKGMDMSFSGLLTRAKQLFEKGESKEDLCYSLQETAFAMLCEVCERAMANTGKQSLLLVGGVGANKRFCEMLESMCSERGATFYKVPLDLVGDNGAMIAWEGYLRRDESGDISVKPHWRVDEV